MSKLSKTIPLLPMRLFWAVGAIVLVLNMSSALAEESAALKPDVPKLDTAPPVSEVKPKAPLKGQVRHDSKAIDALKGSAGEDSTSFSGKSLKGRSGSARMRGRSSDERLNAQVQSGIGIIGVKFIMAMGRPPVINRVFPLTPAFQEGVKANDVIVAVDGIPTLGLAKEEVYDMIVGTPGTPVTLSLARNGDFRVLTLMRMDLNDITDPFVRRDYLMSM